MYLAILLFSPHELSVSSHPTNGTRWIRQSDVGEHSVQRARNIGQVQGFDQPGRGLDLAASPGAHEPPQLLLGGTASPLGLALEGAESPQLALRLEDSR